MRKGLDRMIRLMLMGICFAAPIPLVQQKVETLDSSVLRVEIVPPRCFRVIEKSSGEVLAGAAITGGVADGREFVTEQKRRVGVSGLRNQLYVHHSSIRAPSTSLRGSTEFMSRADDPCATCATACITNLSPSRID